MPSLAGAAMYGHLQIVKILLSNGADINQATDAGLNAVQFAGLYGHMDTVDYLVKKGADLETLGTIAKSCQLCGKTSVTLMQCAGCRAVSYCSPECQKTHWKGGGDQRHKVQCARLKEAADKYKARQRDEVKEVVEGMKDLNVILMRPTDVTPNVPGARGQE